MLKIISDCPYLPYQGDDDLLLSVENVGCVGAGVGGMGDIITDSAVYQ